MITHFKSASPSEHGIGFRIVCAVLAGVFAFSAAITAFAGVGALQTTVVDGENSVSISSKTNDPSEIVKLAGINIDANDELDLAEFDESDGGKISIDRANLVRVDDNGLIGYYLGYSDTISEMFRDQGVILNDGDVISLDVNEKIFDGMRLSIKRAFSVGLDCDGKIQKLAIADGTVADALKKAGVELGEEDIVTPALDTELTGFTNIKVYRVRYETSYKSEPVPFGTDIVYDSDMFAGESKISSQGVNGEKRLYYTDKYIDNVLAESTFKEEAIVKQPVNQVKKVGSKSRNVLSVYKNTISPISELDIPASVKVDSNGCPVNYKYKVSAKATAYTGDPETSTGRTPMPGHIAVDPTEYPYGTELYITSADGTYVYGYCIAADTGGFVEMGNTDVDLYMNNEEMCYDWGNRPITIYVLN